MKGLHKKELNMILKKRKVRISLNDDALTNMIMELLSRDASMWTYKSITQELIIDRNVKDINNVQQRIYEWLRT